MIKRITVSSVKLKCPLSQGRQVLKTCIDGIEYKYPYCYPFIFILVDVG